MLKKIDYNSLKIFRSVGIRNIEEEKKSKVFGMLIVEACR